MSIRELLQGLMSPNKDDADKARVKALGSGQSSKAANTIVSRKEYNDYAINQQSAGEKAVSFDEYARGVR